LTAVQQAQKEGISVALAHIRYLNPFPSNLGEILSRYEKVLIPELNMGQLRMLMLQCRPHCAANCLDGLLQLGFFCSGKFHGFYYIGCKPRRKQQNGISTCKKVASNRLTATNFT
jgi:hypothetical protein